jgi:putative transposase
MLPRHEFARLANTHDGKRRSDALSRWSQFVALTMGHLGGRSSLRDIEATLQSQSQHRYHLGSQLVSKSALGRANESLDYQFFEKPFQALYQRCTPKAPGHGFRFKHKLFSLDASLIGVSMKIFPWANYNRMKAAFKLHVGLDHAGLIPAFAAVTRGQVSDMSQAHHLDFPRGSVVVFDKGYSDYGWHKSLTDKGVFFVTRIRGNAKYRVLEHRNVPQGTGITSDQTIQFTSVRSSRKDLLPVRRIGYRDPETNRHYVFITNQRKWSAKTIADIYKQRWQVELFFKWIKQNLKIKAFLGTSENAVMTQILVALCLYLLLAYLKFQSRIGKSLQQAIRLLQMNLFVRRPLLELLRPIPQSPPPNNQLRLGLVRN